MTTNLKTRKYSKNVIRQAEWQMAGLTSFEDLLKVSDHPSGTFSFRNLEIYLHETDVPLTFNDYHLLVEMVVNVMPSNGNADFDRPMPMFSTICDAFHEMMNHSRINKIDQAEICKRFLKSIKHYRAFEQKWGKLVQDFLIDKPNTDICYMYRCAANYKDYEEIVVPGHLAVADIKDDLIDNENMIAHQVGLRSPQDHLKMDPELDHCLCELVSVSFTASPPTEGAMTAKELKKRFNNVKWDFAEATERFKL